MEASVGSGARPLHVAVTPGWLRCEHMLEAFGVEERNWRDATARI